MNPPDPTPSPALQCILDNELPIPERFRYQPLRLGLIGVWEYEVQEFYFYGGRLILRGRNGSGKTKVIEVSSPLLFDAVLAAHRLDPFGTTARTMKDNLLHRGRTHRVGYSWCEYGRVTEGGEFEFVTVGIGMRANSAHKGIMHDPWFFVTGKRLGRDFELVTSEGKPLLRAELESRLNASEVFSERRRYRTEVARTLFGFSPARLRALVELLLALRKPKLSENFNGQKLSRMLSDGLPPVSISLLDDLALRFDQLTRDRDELRQQERHQTAMRSFLVTYRRFARRWSRCLGEALVEAQRLLTKATTDRAAAHERFAAADDQVETAKAESRRLDERRAQLESALGQLRAGPLMEEHGLLMNLQQQAEEAEGRLPELNSRHSVSEKALADASEAVVATELKTKEALVTLVDAEAAALTCASQTKAEDAHRQQSDLIRTDPEQAETLLDGTLQARVHVLEQAAIRAKEVLRVEGERDLAAKALQTAAEQLARAGEAVTSGEKRLAGRAQELCARLVDWSEQCTELRMTDQELSDLQGLSRSFGLPSAPTLEQRVRDLAAPGLRSLVEAGGVLSSEQSQQQGRRERLAGDRARVAKERDPLPPPPAHSRRDRDGAEDGAPLWRLLDFAPDISPAHQAGLEAALLGAGLLDAWVTPDGELLSADQEETVLLAQGGRVAGGSLAEVLRPVPHQAVGTETTLRLLERVALATGNPVPEGTDWIACDGSWGLGPMRGRTAVEHSAYIGVAAREAERRRRIALLDKQIAEVDAEILRLDEQRQAVADRLDELAADCAAASDLDQPVREVQQELATGREVFQIQDAHYRARKESLDEVQAEFDRATSRLASYARQQWTPTGLPAIEAEQEALRTYRGSLNTLFRSVDKWRHCTRESEAVSRLQHAAQDQLKQAGSDLAEATVAAVGKRAAYDERREMVGKEVDEVLRELKAKETQLAEVRLLAEENRKASELAWQSRGRRANERDHAEELVTKSRAGLELHEAAYRGAEQLGITLLADPVGSEQYAAVERALELLSRLQDEPYDHASLDQARDELDTAKSTLELELAGQDWQVRSSTEDRLVSVRLLHNGRSIGITEALGIVEAEVHERTRLLSDSEYTLFTEVLLGQLGEHLRQCRVRAKNLIDEMNRLLSTRKTASGQKMRLIWEPDPQWGSETAEAIDIIDEQASRFLPDASREKLIAFLGTQVTRARNEMGGADWKTHLREALDYRKWSQIRIQYKPGPQQRWLDIDTGMHGKGSGGEKAVMLQLPLFVAAAAHYSSAAPTAPRPVYLDEAFAGVDAEMRGECMGLLVDLDLDFIMASHDEWGFYEEVPALANYHLFRNPEIEGVLVTPTIWDGGRRHLLVDPDLLGGAAIDFGEEEPPDDLVDDRFPDDEDDRAAAAEWAVPQDESEDEDDYDGDDAD